MVWEIVQNKLNRQNENNVIHVITELLIIYLWKWGDNLLGHSASDSQELSFLSQSSMMAQLRTWYS